MYRSRMKQQLAGCVLLTILAMPFVAQAAGSSVVKNDQMPVGGSFVAGSGSITNTDSNLILDIVQNGQTASSSGKIFLLAQMVRLILNVQMAIALIR